MGQIERTKEQQAEFEAINIKLESARVDLKAYWNKWYQGRKGSQRFDFFIEHNHRNPGTGQTEEIEPDVNQIRVNEH